MGHGIGVGVQCLVWLRLTGDKRATGAFRWLTANSSFLFEPLGEFCGLCVDFAEEFG